MHRIAIITLTFATTIITTAVTTTTITITITNFCEVILLTKTVGIS